MLDFADHSKIWQAPECLNKQWSCWWFEMLWCSCDVTVMKWLPYVVITMLVEAHDNLFFFLYRSILSGFSWLKNDKLHFCLISVNHALEKNICTWWSPFHYKWWKRHSFLQLFLRKDWEMMIGFVGHIDSGVSLLNDGLPEKNML